MSDTTCDGCGAPFLQHPAMNIHGRCSYCKRPFLVQAHDCPGSAQLADMERVSLLYGLACDQAALGSQMLELQESASYRYAPFNTFTTAVFSGAWGFF